MNKSILLIAPLTFLISCTGSSEIFDDAYNQATTPKVEKVNDEEGYADYIKSEENQYPVEVEESENRSMNGVNPSYYGQNGYNDPQGHSHIDHNGQYYNGQNGYYNDVQFNCDGISNNWNPNGYHPWNVCQYSCMTFYRTGRCWHVDRQAFYGSGLSYGQNMNSCGMGPNSNYFYCGVNCGNGYYNNGCNQNGWANNSYWNNYYGNNYCGNGYYNGYGNYYNGYGNYYGGGWNPYMANGYNPYYGWGMNGINYNGNGWNGNGWNGNNNFSDNEVYAGNHHYGHRGGSNSGSHSQNNTTYEHTVKTPELASTTTPFPSYNATQEHNMVSSGSQGTTSGFGGNVTANDPNLQGNNMVTTNKPAYVNTYSTNDQPGSFSNSKPVNSQTTPIYGNNVTNTPVESSDNNAFSTTPSNKPSLTTNNLATKGTPANNQFSSRTTPTYTSSKTGNTSSNNNTYINPNKYGTTDNSGTTYTPSTQGTTYGKTNPNSRRTYNSGSNNGGTNYNGGSNGGGSNRGGSYNSGSSSSGSSSSRSGSSNRGSSNSGSTGGSSRRR